MEGHGPSKLRGPIDALVGHESLWQISAEYCVQYVPGVKMINAGFFELVYLFLA